MCSQIKSWCSLWREALLYLFGFIVIAFIAYMIVLGVKSDQSSILGSFGSKPQTKPYSTVIKWVYNNSNSTSYSTCEAIVVAAMKTDKPLLLIALIEYESLGFTSTAVSKKGAIGLTQIMPKFWEKELIEKGIIKERRDLFSVGPSVAAGDYVLTQCLNRSDGDVAKALEIYLGAPSPYYVRRILNNLANLYLIY